MNTLDAIFEHYQKPELTQEQVEELNKESSEHLWNYLCGDGDTRHLYNYYDCMEKLS